MTQLDIEDESKWTYGFSPDTWNIFPAKCMLRVNKDHKVSGRYTVAIYYAAEAEDDHQLCKISVEQVFENVTKREEIFKLAYKMYLLVVEMPIIRRLEGEWLTY